MTAASRKFRRWLALTTPEVIDFVDDIRLVGESGGRDALAASMTGMMSVLERLGVRYHTKEG